MHVHMYYSMSKSENVYTAWHKETNELKHTHSATDLY